MSDKKKKQRLTENPNDPELRKGISSGKTEDQNKVHLILPEEERKSKNKVRNVYEHVTCGTLTEIPLGIAETFAAKPHFYSATYCATCKKYRPVSEFFWHPDKIKVGS